MEQAEQPEACHRDNDEIDECAAFQGSYQEGMVLSMDGSQGAAVGSGAACEEEADRFHQVCQPSESSSHAQRASALPMTHASPAPIV